MIPGAMKKPGVKEVAKEREIRSLGLEMLRLQTP
jgi:hypothetical protein